MDDILHYKIESWIGMVFVFVVAVLLFVVVEKNIQSLVDYQEAMALPSRTLQIESKNS